MEEEGKKTSVNAVASLVLGVVSVVFFGIFTGIPGVICGHIALSAMKKDSLIAGRGMAIAGLSTGYLGIAISLFLIFLKFTGGSEASINPFLYSF